MNTEEAHAMNSKRADNAQRATQAYRLYRDGWCEHSGQAALRESARDLLTDLRHLAAQDGWDFDDAMRISAYHFEAEHAAAEADKDTGE